jgi:hypothetical protein
MSKYIPLLQNGVRYAIMARFIVVNIFKIMEVYLRAVNDGAWKSLTVITAALPAGT